ncbi:MAG: hypothetical protein IT226_02110 [Flavobacteriales bacterium]|nr:hypothetical protein [Flavobacteriales bacterium]
MRRRSHRSSHGKTSGDEPLPVGFIDHLGTVLGESFPGLEAALNAPAPTSIRLNPKKPFEADLDPVPWCTTGRYVVERPAFTLDPLFHAGAYYVQEASSMLLEKAVAAAGLLSKNILALDLCAAPGGKSTHLLSLLGDGALLVANERDHLRKLVLAENIWKFGAGHSMITGCDANVLRSLPDLFDLILVDAPCSGEGMFRKDPFARRQWSPQLVQQCASVQQQLVPLAWHALAPGGTLIYSTCTWEPSENEAQLRPLLEDGGTCLELDPDGSWGVVRSGKDGVIGYRCYPDRVRGEGFFIAVVRKAGEAHPGRERIATTPPAEIPWLLGVAGASIMEHNAVLHAVPAQWRKEIDAINAVMATHAPGTPFAERKGDAWVPHPAAATSCWLDRSVHTELDLPLDQALAFLSGAALPGANARDPALVTHRGLPLGWVHGAGNRWNNRWPAPWRIRTQRSGAPRVSWQ